MFPSNFSPSFGIFISVLTIFLPDSSFFPDIPTVNLVTPKKSDVTKDASAAKLQDFPDDFDDEDFDEEDFADEEGKQAP